MSNLAGWYRVCFARAMANIYSDGSSPKLELVGDTAPAGDTPVEVGSGSPAAKPAVTAATTSADRFLSEAIREYEAGRIDQRLWMRAVVQAEGDDSRTIAAYVRARATALRVIKRDKRLERSDRRELALRAAHGSPDSASHNGGISSKAGRVARGNAKPLVRYRTVIAAMLGSLVVVAGLLGAYWASNSTQQPIVAAPAPRSGPATRTAKPPVASNSAAINANNDDPSREFMARIQELKNAGNWNVLVLHASAWTRKEPGNAAAWNELSIGYVNMRQFDDAYVAAKKAVQLAPKDALLWRNLGQLGLDLDEPVDALRAFEEATRWNDRDAYSFVQAGILNARLGRLPEARLAFDKALALSPEDADARCGVALVAQGQARPKGASATAGQAKPPDGKCRDLIERAGAAVALKDQATFKVVPSRDR